MHPESTPILDKILEYTMVAATALQDIAVATQIPFLNSVCTLSLAIILVIANTKFQKERYIRMIEDIHQLLCALMSLCFHSDKIRSPELLEQIAEYSLTLQKFHACLKGQQDLGKIKRMFKQNKITAELDACEGELKAATEIFVIKYGVGIASALLELGIDTERRHQGLLELISSEGGSFNNASSMRSPSFNTSSSSVSLLPPSPQIFYGREAEVKDIIDTLLTDPARAAILGPGGMGKTTLATAALNHPAIIEKYSLKYFISCESSNTYVDLVYNVGFHLGLEPSGQLSKEIVRHFERSGLCLVVLDNFETPWEPMEFRGQVEEFISLLADIPTVALLITMRGAERPEKVKWNRPFLPPLKPISPSATRQIFSNVAEEPVAEEESALNHLIELSGSLPLAVTLMANIASFEGYSGTLSRWEVENTALLSDGDDKRSNLEKSITLSLGSPRISSSPHAKNLISLLSLLPDGIMAEDLLAAKVPISEIRHSQSLLLRTSLAYVDVKGRLKILNPIREFIRRVHPPSLFLSKPLRTHFQGLLALWQSTRQLSSGNLAREFVSYLGNVNELILEGLCTEETSALIAMGYSIIALDVFSVIMLRGHGPLTQKLPHLIETTGDPGLRWGYVKACLYDEDLPGAPVDLALMVEEGVHYFNTEPHSIDEVASFYCAAAQYYRSRKRNIRKATEFIRLALALAHQTDAVGLQATCMHGEYHIAQACDDPCWALKVALRARNFGDHRSDYQWIIRMAWSNCRLGNLSQALSLCSEADERLRSVGMEASDRHLALVDIRAEVHLRKSEYMEARELHEQIVNRTSSGCSPHFHANSLVTAAYLDILIGGELAKVLANLNAAEAVYASLGRGRTLLCSWLTAEINLYRGELQNARSSFLDCLSRSRGIDRELQLLCLASLGDSNTRMHEHPNTFYWAVVYLASSRMAKDPVDMSHALRCLGDVCVTMEDEETALNLFHAALDACSTMDIHRLRAECMVRIGDIMIRRGDSIHAKEMWMAAQPLFVRSYRMEDAASVDKRLEELSLTQQADSRFPRAGKDGGVGQSALVGSSTTATDTLEMSLEKLAILSAPNNSLWPEIEVPVVPRDGQSKLPAV